MQQVTPVAASPSATIPSKFWSDKKNPATFGIQCGLVLTWDDMKKSSKIDLPTNQSVLGAAMGQDSYMGQAHAWWQEVVKIGW